LGLLYDRHHIIYCRDCALLGESNLIQMPILPVRHCLAWLYLTSMSAVGEIVMSTGATEKLR